MAMKNANTMLLMAFFGSPRRVFRFSLASVMVVSDTYKRS